MTTPVNDSEYVKEAQAQRDHELRLAEMAADRDAQLARIRASSRDKRRPYIATGVALAFLLALVLGLTMLVMNNNRTKRLEQEQHNIRQMEVAKACVAAGNIWVDNNCLLTRKPEGSK